MAMRIAAACLCLLLVGAAPGRAEETEATAQARDGRSGFRSVWSATVVGVYTRLPSPESDNDFAGWFDQYEFTPNKGSDFPFQIGVREASFDLFRGERAVFQSRLRSPSANLGVSGSQADDPFFNQHLDALTRLRGLDLDVRYRRIRTEQLRLFPNTAGAALVFDDRTRRDDRFYRDRTGFESELRIRPYESLELPDDAPGAWIRPQLALRGGYEDRDGDAQLRIHRGPSNDWVGLAPDRDRSVAEVGTGLVVAPDGLFTLSFDFDHERVRIDDPVLTDGDLGFPPPQASTIGFVPETDRYTGTLRFSSQLHEGLSIEGGLLVSELEQVSEYTPEQRSSGLRDNEVRSYGAQASIESRPLDDLSLRGHFKYDRRQNEIERNTSLFNAENQIDPFVEDWERWLVGGEAELQLARATRVGVGLRYEEVARDLDYAPPVGLRILPSSAQIDRDTRTVSLYGTAAARPWRRLRIDAELGYRWAPDTGYASELDDNLYGELRASYVLAFARPVHLSASLRGSTGENDDFSLVSGQGPVPAGTRLGRSYERSSFLAGLSASFAPLDRVSLSASFFYGRDDQDSNLDLSSLQRYFQDTVPIDFSRDGDARFENKQTSLVLGMHAQLTEATDASASYSFARAKADYGGSDDTVLLDLVGRNQRIESTTHVLDLELRHRLAPGLEVLAGYRYQDYDDDAPRVESVASVVAPFDRSTRQHTATVGVTLSSEFFERR